MTRRDAMRDAVLDWEVKAEGWKALAPSLRLPDPDDVHVLAAAIAGHADCIVTTNLKDFPASVLEIYGLVALHPDDFIVAQLDLDLYVALGAFKAMRERKRNPAYSSEEFATAMERNGLVATARHRRAVASGRGSDLDAVGGLSAAPIGPLAASMRSCRGGGIQHTWETVVGRLSTPTTSTMKANRLPAWSIA